MRDIKKLSNQGFSIPDHILYEMMGETLMVLDTKNSELYKFSGLAARVFPGLRKEASILNLVRAENVPVSEEVEICLRLTKLFLRFQLIAHHSA